MPAVEQNPAAPASLVEALVTGPALERGAKAFLLLRLCQLAQFARPAAAHRYWALLAPVLAHLPADHKDDLTALRASFDPARPARAGGFAGQIAGEVSAASALVETNPDEARRRFDACEQRVAQRWWPLGKRGAWEAVVDAWARVDRPRTLGLLGRLRPARAKSVVLSLNRASRLTAEEWDAAHASMRGSAAPAICDLLDDDRPAFRLSQALFASVGDALLAEMRATPAMETESRKIEAKRETAFNRYLRLVACAEATFPGIVALMESLVLQTATKAPFEKWPDRFAALRRLIIFWAELPTHRAKAQAVLDTKLPAHLRDFALAQWHAMLPTAEADARAQWTTLRAACKDEASVEIWFLVTLLRRGLPAVALAMARESARQSDLVPRMRRAWLLHDPLAASAVFSDADMAGDCIGEFIRLAGVSDRVAWLRQRSDNGAAVLADFWGRPTYADLIQDVQAEKHLLSLYTKDEGAEKQFASYVRLHGHGHYGYETLDPILLETLVAWDDRHPLEVERFLKQLWSVMQPDTSLLRMDVLRNAIFERCQVVLSARPASFDDLFVAWVKREAVDKTIREQVGNTIYTFSLKDTVPFIYCLLGAQHVAKHSVDRCRDLLSVGARSYTTTPDLMSSAARLFAADRRLDALEPPVPLKNPGHRGAWQIGVLQASAPDLLDYLTSEVDAGQPQPA